MVGARGRAEMGWGLALALVCLHLCHYRHFIKLPRPTILQRGLWRLLLASEFACNIEEEEQHQRRQDHVDDDRCRHGNVTKRDRPGVEIGTDWGRQQLEEK